MIFLFSILFAFFLALLAYKTVKAALFVARLVGAILSFLLRLAFVACVISIAIHYLF